MEFINYFFASVISFLGLLIGIILVKIAPEEQKLLGKKFSLLRKFFLLLIFIFMILYYLNNIFYSLTLIVYFIFLLFVEYKIVDSLKKSMIIYGIFGILFFLSSNNIGLFTVTSSLILLYGLPTASLIYKIKEKNHYKIMFYNIGFVVIANMLFTIK